MNLVRAFRNLSIRRKLTLIVMVTTGAALLLASAGLLTYDVVTFRKAMITDLEVAAEGLNINLTAALDFGDARAAEDILSALRARPRIIAACVYAGSTPFAQYQRADVTKPFAPPALPGKTRFADGQLHVFRSFVTANETSEAPTIYIQSDMTALS
jgi:hypothetical protein